MTTAIKVCDANTPEWREARRSGVGASDAAAAVGLSRWRTPLEVWADKVYGIEDAPNRAMLLGTLMEPVVATLFAMEMGIALNPSPGLYRHPDIEWMLASPDAGMPDGRLAEFKTTTSRNEDYGDEGTDEIPIDALCQVQQQMAVTGAPAVVVAVLVLDTRELKTYNIDRHSKFIDGLIAKESKFWDCVRYETPPPIDLAQEGAAAAVRRSFRTVEEGKAVDLDDEAVFLANCMEEHGRSIRDLEKTRDEIKAKLALRMQDAEIGRLPNGKRIVRKAIESSVAAHVRKYVTLTVKDSK